MQEPKYLLRKLIVISTIITSLFMSACSEKTPEEIEADNQKQISVSVRRAKVLMYEDSPKNAIKLLEDTFIKCGENAELLETLANAYVQDNDSQKAAKYFEAASEQKGGDTQLLLTAAKAYQQAGMNESASKAYEQYLQLKPTDIFVWKTLSENYLTQQKYQQALDAYSNAIKTIGKTPSIVDATKIGSLYVLLENYTEARKWLEAAFKASQPEHIEVKKDIFINLIKVYLAQKEAIMLTSAIKELDKIDATLITTKHPQLANQIRDFFDNLKAEKLANEQKAIDELKAKQEAKNIEDLKAKEETVETTEVESTEVEKTDDAKKSQPTQEVVEEVKEETTVETTDTAEQIKEPLEDKKSTQETIEPKEEQPTEPKEEPKEDSAKTVQEPVAEDKKEEKLEDLTDVPALEAAILQNEEAQIKEEEAKDFTDAPAETSKYDTYIQKCYEAIEVGDAKSAQRYAHKAIAEDSDPEAGWRALGKAYEIANKDTDSYLAATQAYKRNPDDINATLFYLRNASRVLNNEKFLNEIYQAYEKFPNNPEIWYGLAKTYKLLNNQKNALYFYNLFLKNTSSDHPLYEEMQKDFIEIQKDFVETQK